MRITENVASTIKCLSDKMRYAGADPDPTALSKLNHEYNCENCDDAETCNKVQIAIESL